MRNTKITICAMVMVLGACESGAIASVDPVGTWTTLDVPGATGIIATGIDGDNIVVQYQDATGWYGAVYDGMDWTIFEPTGATATWVQNIDGGNAVGWYSGGTGSQGFIYDGTSCTTLNVPVAQGTHAYGIDGNNIVGYYRDGSGANHGFLYDGTDWTTLDMPGATLTYARGIDGDNIVGVYRDSAGDYHGYLYDGTEWTTLDMPGAHRTGAWDIDGDNIVGLYYDNSGGYHGFLYDGTDWTSLDAPGATGTLAYGVDGNKIVGTYANGPGHQGFVYVFAEPYAPPVAVDIKPTSCPNPLSVYSYGILPVAILGTEEFDVNEIDVASVRLNDVAPIRHNYEDVATPVIDANDCNCSAEGADGYVDLIVKFETEDIVGTLADVNDGDVVELSVTGVLTDETPIEGSDCIVIQGRHKPMNRGDINKDGMVNMIDLAVVADNWLECNLDPPEACWE